MKRECRPGVIYWFHFLYMKKHRKDRNGWIKIRHYLYNRIKDDPDFPDDVKMFVEDHKDGLYETPKEYDADGYSYNDGSWLRFRTGCMYNGKFSSMMICANSKSVVDCLYGYMCFLRKLGIVDGIVIYYFSVVFILDKLDFNDGVFPGNRYYMNIVENSIRKVLSFDVKDIDCDCGDERKFCMKEGSRSEKARKRQMKKGELTDKKIEELYDPGLTNNQNLMKFRKNGLDIKERTLQRWKKRMGF